MQGCKHVPCCASQQGAVKVTALGSSHDLPLSCCVHPCVLRRRHDGMSSSERCSTWPGRGCGGAVHCAAPLGQAALERTDVAVLLAPGAHNLFVCTACCVSHVGSALRPVKL